jgi:methylated-DNA-[protein]-cysteine S-methyltransferase
MANATDERYACRMSICYIDSPVGRLALEADGDTLTRVRWTTPDERSNGKGAPVLSEAARQLDRYFNRKLARFDLKLAGAGTAFQNRVWAMMRAIPYGETATYGGMAIALGSGPRAVGMACGRNPIPIIVPCHRVLGSGGSEGGFSGGEGLPTKRKLLAIEGVHPERSACPERSRREGPLTRVAGHLRAGR